MNFKLQIEQLSRDQYRLTDAGTNGAIVCRDHLTYEQLLAQIEAHFEENFMQQLIEGSAKLEEGTTDEVVRLEDLADDLSSKLDLANEELHEKEKELEALQSKYDSLESELFSALQRLEEIT